MKENISKKVSFNVLSPITSVPDSVDMRYEDRGAWTPGRGRIHYTFWTEVRTQVRQRRGQDIGQKGPVSSVQHQSHRYVYMRQWGHTHSPTQSEPPCIRPRLS